MNHSTELNQQRIAQMTQRLEASFEPIELTIQDDSHLHAGHAGAKSGKGHFTVFIKSNKFEGLRTLKQHQLVYESLGSLMQTDIHALVIKVS